MNSKNYFGTYAPRGFFVSGRKAYPFNRFHAPLGQTKPCLPREEEALGPVVYAYGEADAPWKSPDFRAAYFDRLAGIERSHDVEWVWDPDTPGIPGSPPAAFFSATPLARKGYIE